MSDIDDRILDVISGTNEQVIKPTVPINDVYDFIIDIGQKNINKAKLIGRLLYQAGYMSCFVENGNDIIADMDKIPEQTLRNIYEVVIDSKN